MKALDQQIPTVANVGKKTLHSQRTLGKIAQGVHSDTTRTKTVQKEKEKLSQRRRCSSESRFKLKSLATCPQN